MQTLQNQQNEFVISNATWWQSVILAALAGGMAWGIRGQYGHETGAMIAGVLVSLTLCFLLCPRASVSSLAKTVAWTTVAMGFGGSMTYGQTVGLTHDAPLVGHWGALAWGLLGLAVKGGVWIGFAGVFMGMGLGGKRYRAGEICLLMLVMIAVYGAGVYLINQPYQPQTQKLPWLYFSDHWDWEPGADLEPRRENWGGLWFALLAALIYTRWRRKDRLALRMGLFGMLGGALGFPLGQSLQAYHAWNLEAFRSGWWAAWDPHINWWNMMETTYGAIMGAMLGLGLWLNRKLIQPAEPEPQSLLEVLRWGLLLAHLPMLILVEFAAVPAVDMFYDLGLIMGIIPLTAIAAGRWWPYAVVFPLTLLPIAGKTVRQLVYNEAALQPLLGWVLYFLIPLSIAVYAAVRFYRREDSAANGMNFLRAALLINAWLYFLLNFAFFRYPWPWVEWTYRTPNAIIFTVCVVGLTLAVWRLRGRPARVQPS